MKGTKWSIASGGKQDEIVNLLKKKLLLVIFDNGIYGSPTPKMEIVKKTILNVKPNEKNKFVLIGDSFYDYECAKNAKLPCILLSHGYSNININKLENNFNKYKHGKRRGNGTNKF